MNLLRRKKIESEIKIFYQKGEILFAGKSDFSDVGQKLEDHFHISRCTYFRAFDRR